MCRIASRPVQDGRLALGIVLFELLTGDLPFRGEYQEALSYSILNEQPATLPDQPEVDRIIKRMLRKDPLQRYQSVDEMLADLLARRAPVEQRRLHRDVDCHRFRRIAAADLCRCSSQSFNIRSRE